MPQRRPALLSAFAANAADLQQNASALNALVLILFSFGFLSRAAEITRCINLKFRFFPGSVEEVCF
jgi:hypothetical protein